jgi:hypothetical protein
MKILHDVFPAFVGVAPADLVAAVQDLQSAPITPGAYQLTKSRIVITDEVVTIAIDGNEGPMIVFRERYTEFHKSNVKTEDSYIITETGKMLAYKKDENCGCGSRLRSWNPYRHVYSSQDPTEEKE